MTYHVMVVFEELYFFSLNLDKENKLYFYDKDNLAIVRCEQFFFYSFKSSNMTVCRKTTCESSKINTRDETRQYKTERRK